MLPPGYSGREELKPFLSAISQTYRRVNAELDAARQKAEHAAESQRFFRHVLDFIPADIAVIDSSQRYLFVNKSAIKDPEVREWIIGKTDGEYHAFRGNPAAFSAARKRDFDEVLTTKQPKTLEEKIQRQGKEAEYNLRILHPVLNSDGEADIVIVYGVNITERKRAEELVRKSELRYRDIFNNSQALICTHDLEGRVTDLNDAAAKAFGYSRAELNGRLLSDLLAKDKAYDFHALYLDRIKQNGKADGVMVALNSRGEKLYLLYQNFLVNAEGEQPYVIGFSQDITARVKAEKALRTSEEKYRSIIENMNLGLLQVTPEENIVYANQSFCKMSGYTADELLGKNAPQLFSGAGGSDGAAMATERRKHGESDVYELEVMNKNGEQKWWLISGAPIYDDRNEFIGSIGIHLDITSQKQLEEDLRWAKSEAEKSAHTKEIFLANMSHEIRTPMNAIIGLGKLLARTRLDGQQSFYLEVIRSASDNLMVIINDLLDFSRIEAGKVTMEKMSFRLNDHVSKSLQILKYKAEEKGLLLECRCDERIAEVLVGDPYRLSQVLMNLLSNAVKFTERGSVTMECSLVEDRGSEQALQFRVTDTGIGMSEEFMEHLFDKFSQEDESISRRYGGTGLGMSISKQLIELMGGQIHVASKKNEGTSISFTLRLPVGNVSELQDTEEVLPDAAILSGRRILLAEDNAMNRLLVTTILSQYGAAVTEVADGQQAVQALATGSYDVVLMDMQMPVMNGLEATRAIRAGINATVPIIALTANAQQQEAQRCRDAGMNDFIAKPFDEGPMVTLIARWLGQSVQQESGVKEEKKPADTLIDLAGIHAMGIGDEFVRNLSELFLEEMTAAIRKMEEAVMHNDMQALSDAAHKIKPSFQTFGVTAIMNDLIALESMGDTSDLVNAGKLFRNVRKVADRVAAELRAMLQKA